MKLQLAIYIHVDINPEHYGLTKDVATAEACEKLSEYLNESSEDVVVLFEQNASNVVVSEIKPGEGVHTGSEARKRSRS